MGGNPHLYMGWEGMPIPIGEGESILFHEWGWSISPSPYVVIEYTHLDMGWKGIPSLFEIGEYTLHPFGMGG